MAIQLVAEETIVVGEPTSIEGASPSEPYAIVFEDDGQTGYLYGLDLAKEDNPIVDAMQIYNVADVSDGSKPSVVQLVWSSDGLKAGVLINRFLHAVFDFEARRGYCRTGFPPPDKKWSEYSHEWTDDAQELLK